MKIKMIMAEKRNHSKVGPVPTTTTVREAAKLMLESKAGALLVKKAQEGPDIIEGLVSKTDIIKVVAEKGDLDAVRVGEIMTTKIIVATINDDVDYILQVMTRHKINHMPVIDGKLVTGVVSMEEIMRERVEETEIRIHHLNDFFGGTYGNQVF